VEFRGLIIYAITAIFGVPLLIAGAMIDPQGLHLGGLIMYGAIMLVAMPFLGWQLLATEFVFPSAGRTRLGAVIGLWIGGTLVAVAAISFIASALSYPRPRVAIDPTGHALIRFAPRAGLAIGLFCLSMLVSCGVWGTVAPILRPQVALSGALISGCVLFAVVYGGGWLLLIP
jgi:hypothetical protein